MDNFQLHTCQTHNQHCEQLQGLLHDHVTTYELQNNSILNSSKFFYVVDSLVPDVMHDILEDMKLKNY